MKMNMLMWRQQVVSLCVEEGGHYPVTCLLLLPKASVFTAGPPGGHGAINAIITDFTPWHFNQWCSREFSGFLGVIGQPPKAPGGCRWLQLLCLSSPQMFWLAQERIPSFTFLLLLWVTRPSLAHTWSINYSLCCINTFCTWMLC